MKVQLLTDANNVVKGVLTLDGIRTGCNFSDFPGDANPAYINTRTWDGVELKEIPKKIITTEEFINLMTATELKALITSEDANAKALMLLIDKSTELNLEDEKITTAVNGLSFFTTERKEVLLGL